MTEVLLLIVIGLLTVNVLFVGVYIVLVLKEVKTAVTKMNQILDSVAVISEAVATPVVGASGAIAAITAGVKAFQKLKKITEKDKNKETDEPAA